MNHNLATFEQKGDEATEEAEQEELGDLYLGLGGVLGGGVGGGQEECG